MQGLLQGGLDARLQALHSQQQRLVSIQDTVHRQSMCMGNYPHQQRSYGMVDSLSCRHLSMEGR